MTLGSTYVSERRTATGARAVRLDLLERWRILILGDLVASGLSALLSLTVWSKLAAERGDFWIEGRLVWIGVLVGAWMLGAALLGSYIRPYLNRTMRSWGVLLGTAGLVLAAYSATYFFAPRSALPRVVVLAFLGTAVLVVGGWRRLWDWASGRESLRRPIIIVGAGRLGETLGSILTGRQNGGYRVLGFIDDDPSKQHAVKDGGWGDLRVLGPSGVLVDTVDRLGVSELVLALRGPAKPELVEAVLACHERGVVVTNATDLYEASTGRLPTWHVGDNWGEVLPLAHPGGRALYLAAKRGMDVLGALIGLGVLIALLPIAALMIKLDSRGPVFYKQRRTGRGGHLFAIWKLRTMTVDAENGHGPKWASVGDQRATRVGRWLRRTHLDELPQLWNVLKGEMSLVGPRPERPEIDANLERTIPFYRLRLAVKPGIAGWGAVNGSYVDEDAKAVERLEYDLYYIKHQSLWLDVQIIATAAHQALLFRGR